MEREEGFARAVAHLAIPAAMQSMLQSSFSIVDQLMIGQLGEVSIAGVGYAGKFASIFTVLVSAIGAAAGILLAQYMGRDDRREVRRSFFLNLLPALGLAALFTALSLLCPGELMRLYTKDAAASQAAAEYLAIIALTYLPLAGATMLSTLLRCAERPRIPLYAAIVSALVNTALNYVLIFGKCGFSPMGARGAAIATVLAQWANFLLMLALLPRSVLRVEPSDAPLPPFAWGQYLGMLLPLFLCEALWSLGENVYTAIYGHLGTESGAAMTLINPVQGLVIGALCGLSQAAGVLVGKRLGVGNYAAAYAAAKRLMLYGAVGAAALSLLVVLAAPLYVEIYRVEESVKLLTRQVLYAYAAVSPFKVLNMILGGGILRSGGRTKYSMFIDLLGTWGFGVPLGLLAGFVWKLTIPWVYFILSLEECVRFAVSLAVFRRKRWMHSLEGGTEA